MNEALFPAPDDRIKIMDTKLSMDKTTLALDLKLRPADWGDLESCDPADLRCLRGGWRHYCRSHTSRI